MKTARIFASAFAAIGAVLLVGSIILCLVSLDAPVEMVGMPKDAMACAEEMMDALAAGDYRGAAARMYGQPDLGVGDAPSGELDALVWNAFVDSMSYEFVGVCYAENSGIYRDASVTALDIASVTAKLQTRAQTLLDTRLDAAEEELTAQEREELAQQVLREALEQAIREDGETVTQNITLKLIYRDGQWWVVPDQALLQAISGGVA